MDPDDVKFSREGIRILLAEGHPLFRQAVRKVLAREHDVSVVAEASGWPNVVDEANKALPDIVLLCTQSLDGNAVQTIHLLRERVRQCHVVVVAAEAHTSLLIDAVEAGAKGYLLMDCAWSELIDAARTVCDGGMFIPPRMLNQFVEGLMYRYRLQWDAFERLSQLTPREREVLELIGDGATNEAIGHTLFISPETVRTHVQNLVAKLGVHSRLEAATYQLQTRAVMRSFGSVPGTQSRRPSA